MTAPDVFEIGDDGQAHVIGDPDGNRELTAEAISNCPTSALSFDD
jgi:ferredoxin